MPRWQGKPRWANGGFESVFTGGLADDMTSVLRALRVVGAVAHADLFESAARAVPVDRLEDFDQRTAFFDSGVPQVEAVSAYFDQLDDQMGALPPIHEILVHYVSSHPEIRALEVRPG